MLNLRRARVPQHQSQRLIWSRASDFVAWLGLVAKRVLRPHPPADISLPAFKRSLDPRERKAAAHALGRFSLEIKHVPSSTQLLDTWQVISQCRPFVVDKEKPLQVRLATTEDVGDDRTWLLQIVPADIFAQLSVDISTRAMFVGSTGPDQDVDVVVANEALMVGNLVKAFHQLNEHKLAVAFFESYDRDRRVWLQEHQLRQAAKNVTQLPRAVYSCYLRSLAALKQSKKIVRLFENDEHQLERICSTVPNLYLLLHACYSEKNGELARQAIDTIARFSPAAVIPLGCYELAIRSNLRDRKRDERELVTAIHLAKALQNDGGYTLKPDIWSGLIKVSLNMKRPDLALEVFKSYPRHCIPEYQINFRQALRAACRFTDSTALDMVRFCWVNYCEEYSNLKTLLEERKAYQDAIFETELLNMVLWEMLKHRHAVPSLVQVLDVMEATRSKGGAVALRRTSSLKFWGERPSVLSGQGFLVYLLLEECVEQQWDDECEFLVDYLLELGVARVPVNTIVKMMGSNEVRGRFEANVRIGEKLLESLSQNNRLKLRDNFYERFLMSYFRLEQFDKVSEQHAKLNLEKRYPHNEVIRTIVHDAAAQ
ncbi:uncharacterized protein PITG_04509 [Phytophthora infestans T30-4]|uniref:Uncharacterized protein n=1 Tax=Phytophthora infestans (strain T30-4) TaxID=403677 RepID=D0N1F1_PHYIT|nr:uncharacterized protein PITG_04509 [Phytophthora infestans T30-4]EEY68130.1 conserved hypothetical protein [Phytophthora infestans T30-4]|eukprot:XP_002905289.1 conserved hypothetical protein [Phytophthora infestans T30-4]